MSDSILDFSKASETFISPSKKFSWYVWLLIISKFLRSCGIYLAFDITKQIDAVNFVWILSAICSLLLGLVQKPFGDEREVKRTTWLRVARIALVRNVGLVLLFYGLSQIGPYRTSLLTEHCEVVLLGVYITILKGSESPRKLRGCICFILAVFSLILLDNDTSRSEGHLHYDVKHLFYVISWMGLSDHEGGLFIVVLAVLFMTYETRCSRRLAPEVGGTKRLNSLIWIASFCLSTPSAVLLWVLQVASPLTPLTSIHLVFVVALLYVAFDFYVSSTSSQKLGSWRAGRLSSLSSFVFTFLLSFVWPQNGSVPHHQVSGGSVLSLFLFAIASVQLTSPGETSDSLESDIFLLHRSAAPNSFLAFAHSTLQSVLADKNSRTIFYFLCVNLGFTFVELIYGVWTNSLGLISDGFHMLFDCSALLMGLTASVMAHWKPTKTFPYGYGRIEILSGFVNGLLLSVIGIMVLVEAVERMFEPPQIGTEKLLTVATLGLIVNLCGILAFRSSSHGHSHGGSQHTHSHSHGGSAAVHHGHSHNINMEGVFLHVLADTLGSVAVIVSSVLVDWYGWLMADPICSIILSLLILSSVFPLVKNSAFVLLLGSPLGGVDFGVKDVINKILETKSVVSCDNPHFWDHSDGVSVATVTVLISGDIPEQSVMRQVVGILKDSGYTHVTVQIEVEKNHVSGVGDSPSPSPWGLGTIEKPLPQKKNEDFVAVNEI